MRDFAARLEETGEFVDTQALAPDGTFVRYDGEGRPPVTDGPFVETKDLIAGWYIIDVESWDRAVQLAGELSAAREGGAGATIPPARRRREVPSGGGSGTRGFCSGCRRPPSSTSTGTRSSTGRRRPAGSRRPGTA